MIPLGYLTGSQMGWHIISNNIVTGPLRQIKTKKPFVCAVVEVNVALLFLLRRQSEVAGRSTRPSHYATLLQVQLLGICSRVVLFDALLVTNLYNLVKSDLRLMAPSLYIVCIHIYINQICRQLVTAGKTIKIAASAYLQRHALAFQLLHPSCDAVIGLVIFVVFIKRQPQELSIFHLGHFRETSLS